MLVFTLHSCDWTSDVPNPGILSLSVETLVSYISFVYTF